MFVVVRVTCRKCCGFRLDVGVVDRVLLIGDCNRHLVY